MRKMDRKATDQHLKELRVDGYTLVGQFAEPDTVERLLELLAQHFDAEKYRNYQGRPERELEDQLVYNLQNKDKRFIDILDDPFLRAVLMENLNDPYYKHLPPEEPNYVLSFYNARSSGSELPLHTDTFMPSPGEKTWTMQAAFVLQDCRLGNGCTLLVPGSHTSGKFVDRELKNVKAVEAKSGDLILWDSRIWHGASANISGKSRWMLIATFSCWWVKQRTDMPRSLPQEIYGQLSDRQKSLLGFCSIPPRDENERLNFKGGYEQLRPTVAEYFS